MRVPNKYTLASYGVVELHTKVISLEYREGTMKFIYELYDQEHLVTKAYMMVHYSDIDEEGGAFMEIYKTFTALFFEYLYRFIQFLLSPIVIYIAPHLYSGYLSCILLTAILTDFNWCGSFLIYLTFRIYDLLFD